MQSMTTHYIIQKRWALVTMALLGTASVPSIGQTVHLNPRAAVKAVAAGGTVEQSKVDDNIATLLSHPNISTQRVIITPAPNSKNSAIRRVLGLRGKIGSDLGNGFSATVSASALAALAKDKSVGRISTDAPVRANDFPTSATTGATLAARTMV
jgi:hypothetical protein